MQHTKFIKVFFWFVIGNISPLHSQITGYSDFFDGALKMLDHPYFRYDQTKGVLRVDVGVPDGVKWQGFTYEMDDTFDLSNNAIMNLKMKSDFNFLLTAYIIDISGFYRIADQKIQQSDTYIDYYIHFENTSSIDSRHITRLQFTPNGNTTDAVNGTIWLDEMKIGTDARAIAGLGGTTEKHFFINSLQNQIKIVDLKNATHIVSSGGASSLTHVELSDITDGYAAVTFDCLPNFSGRDTLLVTATGMSGFADNRVQIPILIEDNASPAMDSVNDLSVQAGDTIRVRLTGIGDGNITVEQPLY